MDIEFRSMATSDKRSAQQKVSEYRDELRNLHNSFTTSKTNAEALALKSSSGARTKLLNMNQKLDQSTATLEKSRQVLAETENIGDQIIVDMESQKDKLKDAKDKVTETKGFTSEARRVLRNMGYRNIIHKICVAFTIVALFGAIVGLGYWGLVEKK
jgi:vesicle transport through interaction with t-SNAREs protein 1